MINQSVEGIGRPNCSFFCYRKGGKEEGKIFSKLFGEEWKQKMLSLSRLNFVCNPLCLLNSSASSPIKASNSETFGVQRVDYPSSLDIKAMQLSLGQEPHHC